MVRIGSTSARVATLGTLVTVTGSLVAASPGLALLLAPALLLFAVLLLGFAPGEQLLERTRARQFVRRSLRGPRGVPNRRLVIVRRRTSLAASALAMRPPPVALAPIS